MISNVAIRRSVVCLVLGSFCLDLSTNLSIKRKTRGLSNLFKVSFTADMKEFHFDTIKQKVSISEAMNSLNQIMVFINNSPSNFTFEIKNVAALNNIKGKISSFHKNSKKQTSLDGWLK